MAKKSQTDGRKVVSRNRRARHDYDLEATYDAGLVLMGSEIKSIRDNKVNLTDGFIQERDGELWLMNAHIAPYDKAPIYGHTDPRRPRKLLLHRKEISQIMTRIRERSYTAVPLTLYLERGLAKVEIAIARGKKQYDKRAAIAERDANRAIQRALKER
ncbi:SsrA-binding protein SmpB [Phototrophicus methaneseepsis]|uniref:SsrA-binding protein n=1 Tax=Phototrophicus methaneseepsis TaxID=2710758 RepID=A0A7S8IC61_9CHLR|nr:SsrA-binding protein SmpB [Phototrophicus methaneseepsis]QPC81210.1 SsrA-binding protein SmpB [Phototrophicus methaneseepsis]